MTAKSPLTGVASVTLGVKVIECDAGVAGAVAGMLLADYGAEVTVLEPPGGCALHATAWWPVLSRGKRTEVLDLTGQGGKEELELHFKDADVVIHPYKRGQSPSELLEPMPEMNAPLISCAISGFGERGALASLPARDLLVSAITGRCQDQVGWEEGPSYLTHLVPSVVAGLIAAQGVSAALLARHEGGCPGRIETSVCSAALAMSELVEVGSRPVRRSLDRHPQGTSPLYSLYECADGLWLQLGCLHSGFVERAISVLGIGPQIEPLRSLPGFNDGVVPSNKFVREPFRAAVADALRRKNRDDWLAQLLEADVPVAPVIGSDMLLTHPQAIAIGLAIPDAEAPDKRNQVGPFARIMPSVGTTRTSAQGTLGVNGASAKGCSPASEGSASGAGRRPRPLEGLTVIELTNLIAGPMAGRCLADLGAKVIKVEPLEGDIFRQQEAPEFIPLNAGKSSLAMNLKSREGLAIARQLLAEADVFLSNLRPGAVDRLGLGYESLHSINPRLVCCQISAFGSRGPLSAMPGGDPLAGALTGMQAAQGGFGGRPVYTFGAPIDYTSGFLAATSILLALCRREQTGEGELVDTSLLDAGALLNAGALLKKPGERDDLPVNQYRLNAFEGLYPTSTTWIAVSAQSPDEAEGLGLMLSTYGQNSLHERLSDEDVARLLWETFAARPAEEWLVALREAGVPCVPVQIKNEIRLSDDWLLANGWTSTYDGSQGKVSFVDRWLSISGYCCESRGVAPALGEDSQRLLESVGIDREAFLRLRGAGVVAGPVR